MKCCFYPACPQEGKSALRTTAGQQAALCLERLRSRARWLRWKLSITLAGEGAVAGTEGGGTVFSRLFPQALETLSCLSASVCLQSVHNHVGLSFLLGRIGSPRSSWSPWTHCKYKNNGDVASRGFNPFRCITAHRFSSSCGRGVKNTTVCMGEA